MADYLALLDQAPAGSRVLTCLVAAQRIVKGARLSSVVDHKYAEKHDRDDAYDAQTHDNDERVHVPPHPKHR